jgi:hypothetical protein
LLPSAAYAKKNSELLQDMRSNNNHETITHLAMPERQLPVLIDARANSLLAPGKAEGFVPSIAWGAAPSTGVRRVQPKSIMDALKHSAQREQFQTEHGAAWSELLDLLALVERVNAGDFSPVIKVTESDVSVRREGNVVRASGESNISGKSLRFAISEAFTKGLGKARFVVWWSTVANKFVPGLYCSDTMTALYASVLSALGTPGGVGVCQKCKTPFVRSRSKQLYCGHKCQVAAGMQRYRRNLEKAAKSKLKSPTKSKKRTGRK